MKDFSDLLPAIEAHVARLHQIMGHVSMHTVVSYLKMRKVHPAVIGVAKGYHCDACAEAKLPRLFPLFAQDDSEPGKHAAIDHFYWQHPLSGSWCRGLAVVDRGSRHVGVYLHQVEPSKTCWGIPCVPKCRWP